MTKKKRNQGIILVLLCVALCVIAPMIMSSLQGEAPDDSSGTSATTSGESLVVQYIDVGQADSSLLFLPNGKVMLIDAGGNATADQLVAYLQEQGVKRIDYLIGTHPHEDHIGGLDAVIENFDIGEIYMPKVDDSQVPTTQTYEDVLTAIDANGLTVTQGKGGMTLFREGLLKAEILAPNVSKYDELNSYSIVIRISYQNTSFLFMGDAESDSEQQILQRYDVEADVIKCGHHGSSTSNSREFIGEVNPKYAIISCGKDNQYGHPHEETLAVLEEQEATVYRTDQDGTITATSNGQQISFETGGASLAEE